VSGDGEVSKRALDLLRKQNAGQRDNQQNECGPKAETSHGKLLRAEISSMQQCSELRD
jgi:hypothetical protein